MRQISTILSADMTGVFRKNGRIGMAHPLLFRRAERRIDRSGETRMDRLRP
jgi:hypothetical protein